MQNGSQAEGPGSAWEFNLSREAVTPEEQALFATDLAQLGLDDVAWLVLNGSVATGTPYSIPKVLRGFRYGKLAGVAYIVECRRYGQSLFPESPLANALDLFPMPICIWLRRGALTDAVSNPGFVVDGVSRTEFVEAALHALRRQYLMGGVVEGTSETSAGAYAAFPFCDYGMIDLHEVDDVADLYADSKNLKRKVNKFRNKGGEIEVLTGALSPETCSAAIECLNSLKTVLISPFQDNYSNLVLQASAHTSERIVHFIARIEDEMVGYHSFARSGNSLYCLSGGFDRTRKSNYHAYENVILASVRYCLDRGLHTIHYGPVVNETKAKMMSRFVQVEQRYFARFASFTAGVRAMMSLTRLASPQVGAYANLDATNATPSST